MIFTIIHKKQVVFIKTDMYASSSYLNFENNVGLLAFSAMDK